MWVNKGSLQRADRQTHTLVVWVYREWEQEEEGVGKKMARKTKSNQCISMATIQIEEQWKPKKKSADVGRERWGWGTISVHVSNFKLSKKLSDA